MGSPIGNADRLLDGENAYWAWTSLEGFGRRDDRASANLGWEDAPSKTRRASLADTTPHDAFDLFAQGAESDAFFRLAAGARMTRYGGDCYGYCLLAAGFVDLVVEAGLKAHDVVALIPIIERAGGRISTWEGNPATAGGRIVAAGDPCLHELALAILAK
jgi:myo-inositol-1(or 4)-monophosphatase